MRTSRVLLALVACVGPGVEARAQDLVLDVPGASIGSGFGSSVAVTTDLDGDGRLDLLVGAPFESAASGVADGSLTGRVSAHSGADGALLLEAHGAQGAELFGWSVVALGDVDGDGAGDLAVGAPNWDAWRGRVQVLSGADGALLLQVVGDSEGDRFGWSLAAVGDVDDDGVPDLAVGAFDDAQPLAGSGSVRVVSLAGGATLREFGGQHAHDHLGSA